MIFNEKDLKNKDKIGIYCIKNTINNKVYVGSTSKSFYNRHKTHFEKLRSNNHKGYEHLQNAVNKYGIDKFEFSILEILNNNTNILKVEEYYINILKSCNRDTGYNINCFPNNPPALTEEVRVKISKSIKNYIKMVH